MLWQREGVKGGGGDEIISGSSLTTMSGVGAAWGEAEAAARTHHLWEVHCARS